MSEVELTDKMLHVSDLQSNPLNPNEMSDRGFNMLVKSIEEGGFIEPLYVRELPDQPGKYRIIGGHHRLEAAKQLGMKTVPCRVRGGEMDEDLEKAQLVRMNVIKGKLSAKKFIKLYESLSKKYTDEVAADMFGFSKEEELQKLIANAKKAMPADMVKTFEQSEKEIKSIKDLSNVLNKLFSLYGNNLKYNYMLFDFQGKQSIWVRCNASNLKDMYTLGELCHKYGITMDSAILFLVKKAAQDAALQEELGKLPKNVDLLSDPALALVDPLNTK